MNKKRVYYVTGFELGWDNMVGIYDADKVSLADLLKEFPEDQYYINDKFIQTRI